MFFFLQNKLFCNIIFNTFLRTLKSLYPVRKHTNNFEQLPPDNEYKSITMMGRIAALLKGLQLKKNTHKERK